MLAFVNDISISPKGVYTTNNWKIIEDLINISSELKNYGIQKIRVPENFYNLIIAGSNPISYHINNRPKDDQRLLISFLANRVETRSSDITEVLAKTQKEKVVDVELNGLSSQLLLEAFLMNCPTVSFDTHIQYQADFLQSTYSQLTSDDVISSSSIKIENLCLGVNFVCHRAFLSEWKMKIIFSKTKWKPNDNPIWNDYTVSMLEKQLFPLSPHGKKNKFEELLEIGTMVAELNAWKFDEAVTSKNNNSGQKRKIFRSKNTGNSFFLSIDFKNPYGRFEIHNHIGKHLGEIAFATGKYIEDGDSKGYHDIVVN